MFCLDLSLSSKIRYGYHIAFRLDLQCQMLTMLITASLLSRSLFAAVSENGANLFFALVNLGFLLQIYGQNLLQSDSDGGRFVRIFAKPIRSTTRCAALRYAVCLCVSAFASATIWQQLAVEEDPQWKPKEKTQHVHSLYAGRGKTRSRRERDLAAETWYSKPIFV